MAEKAPNEEEAEGAGPCESFLDQFLRRLDQTSDPEAGASPSTSGSMPLASSSSEYSSNNPWQFISSSSLNPDLQPHGLLYPGASVTYSANPLGEFPWLLQELDPPRTIQELDSRLLGGPDTDSHDSAQRLYSSYDQQLLGSSSSQSIHHREQLKLPAKDAPSDPIPGGHGSGGSSSFKLDAAGRVPRFGSSEDIRPAGLMSSSGPSFSDPGSQIIGARGPINYRPPTSPLAGGSVTTSAGTSNTSVSSGPSTSNAGEDPEEESGKKEAETSSSRKRKKPEVAAVTAAAGGSGEEAGASGDTPKSDPPKSKPRKRGGAKRLREPRYAIKTRTDVDVLDDGFKWRKYGQKAVKNSPHPRIQTFCERYKGRQLLKKFFFVKIRNYYRCTTPLCPVRKRVERSNEDAGLVITTYEGTHTHQTPGFHRPSAGGYFGDRPLGMGGGLFQSPLGPTGANLLPLPPGFDLPSLQQANALRTFRGLQPNPSFPHVGHQQHQQQLRQLGIQQESLFRAQQFLGLQDPTTFGSSVKQEPFQFSAQPPEGFLSRLPRPFPDLGGSLITRSISDVLPLPRSAGPSLFAGLPAFPNLQSGVPIAGPAGSSSNRTLRDSETRRHEILNAGVGGTSGSSRIIDESLDTLVSSSAGRPNFEESSGQPRSVSSHNIVNILGSGSLDPRGQVRTSLPPQQQQQQQQQQHHQRSIRSGLAAAGLSSSPRENLQGQALESSSTIGQGQGQAEGLLQDMVRQSGPKVSKS